MAFGDNQNTAGQQNSAGQPTPLIQTNDTELDYLKSIEHVLQEMLKKSGMPSQSAATSNKDKSNTSNKTAGGKRRPKNFTSGLQEGVWESVLGPNFRKNLANVSNQFAQKFGLSLQDIPGMLGQQLSTTAMNAFKQTSAGKAFDKVLQDVGNKAASWMKDNLGVDLSEAMPNPSDLSQSSGAGSGLDVGDAVDLTTNIVNNPATNPTDEILASQAGQATAQAGSQALASQSALTAAAGGGSAVAAEGAIASLGSAADTASPYILGAIILLELLSEAMVPAIEGFGKLWDAIEVSYDRYNTSRKEMLKQEQERIKADVEVLIKTPFQILEDAAKNLYDVWDNNLKVINATQGYSKSDLQSLMADFAERLRNEGLSKYVSGADLTSNLTKVLEAGLSGTVAEEFAYIATILESAVPTQDFFSYASTYSSLAANAIKDGKSQSEAIQYANQELLAFASNVLSASRELSGGFSTGLKDAQSLFEQSVQIANASKTGDPSNIASVLTAVAAATGALAPDLATSMTDAIVKAATGGNSSEIVALRSLAGINASNTEFLRQVATNPQKVFAELFTNLAKMQNMSNDNYMEVAEGLSTVFGVSMDAFARIDFNYLANAIADMNVNNGALSENLALLKAGETTTTAEQLKMQQINKYMIEEGLSYVLDNEAARQIQQHMWDEQIALEMKEATYGVELRGAALEFLEGIRATIDNILGFLNPFMWMSKINDLVGTIQESNAQDADIKQLLQLGKVGQGTAEQLHQLTVRGVRLNVTTDLLSQMGGFSQYKLTDMQRSAQTGVLRNLATAISPIGLVANMLSRTDFGPLYNSNVGGRNAISSRYSWGLVDKATASNLFSSYSGVPTGYSTLSSTGAATSIAAQALQKMLSEDYISSFVSEGKSYHEWVASAMSLGIKDFEQSVEDAGYSLAAVQNQFQQYQTKAGAEQAAASEEEWKNEQRSFWEDSRTFYSLEAANTSKIIELLSADSKGILYNIYGTLHSGGNTIFTTLHKFMATWVDHVVKHSVYDEAFGGQDKTSYLAGIRAEENNENATAIRQLAQVLVDNAKDLKDPTVQTNALLAQILLLVEVISHQNNTSSGWSLSDSLSGLALGLTKPTP